MLTVLISVLVISFTVTGYFVLQKQEKDILSETARRGQDISKYLSEAIALHVVSYDYHSIQIMLDEVISSNDIAYAAVISGKGNVMAAAGGQSAADGERTSFSHEIIFDNNKIGLLKISLNNQDIIDRLEQKRNSLLVREIVTVIIIAIGEFLALSYFIARPVSVITDTIEKSIDENGRITSDITINSRDEFGRLATQFNKLRTHLNDVHEKLELKIESADQKLINTNNQLQAQSDELRRINGELEKLSVTDPLTGLYNRRHFEREVENDIAMCARHSELASMIVIDIDKFKSVNDRYGHQNGDVVLVKTAEALMRMVRRTDVLCRIGGEEFVMLCRRTDKLGAMQIAEKLRNTIAHTRILIGNEFITVTISLGIATISSDSKDTQFDDFFRAADVALFQSKENGRNRTTHYSDMEKKNEVML